MQSHAPQNPADPVAPAPTYREVSFRHSRDFVGLLDQLGISLLISTYQANQLVTLGAAGSQLRIELHHFEQAMGIAPGRGKLAVGGRGVVWFLQNARDCAPRLPPPGHYDDCYLARSSFLTGNIHGHEMAWVGDELWIVNTMFSCLCTLHESFSFVPRWRPDFITELDASDRCHLNGLALDAGRPKYVTVLAASNEPGGWRPIKANAGRILDIETGSTVSAGLAMPHSPRVHGGHVWVLNSGHGSLQAVDPRTGQRTVVSVVPGYSRGLAFHDHFAFVGLSKIRETAAFGGVPIAERPQDLKCGVAIVDLRSGHSVAYLEFECGVEEIFDVQVLPNVRSVSIVGPVAARDEGAEIWVVPPPGQVPTGARLIPSGGSAANEPPAMNLSNDDVQALVRSGLALQRQGRFSEAIDALTQAVAARPQSAELHNNLGNAWQDSGRRDIAIGCYTRAIAAQETFSPAHQNLGYVLINIGRLDEGMHQLERAQQLCPSDINRVLLATSLPVVYESSDDLKSRRLLLEQRIRRLVDDGVAIDTRSTVAPTNFFAAYQGGNDFDLQRDLARVYAGADLAKPNGSASPSGRIRVGFMSAYFRDHTIGRLNLGRVVHLDRSRFEVTVISAGRDQTGLAEKFRLSADRHVQLPAQIEQARRQISELELDVLLFADVGMDALTYTLAFSRMAP
ncbi:MAG TPA: TIGR03032 family protein, partial [Pirellulales bacterium]|nr:TIGR03032 family protein [Pirellulales bacterium]